MLQESRLNNCKVALCAIFKNEAPYILEWIAHHRLIGVTDFYIADNISTDGCSELLTSLHDEGQITLLTWPTLPGVKPQLPAYEKLAELAKKDCVDWALFIDADEFVILDDNHPNIQSVITKITTNDYNVSGITLNWATYGSSDIIINSNNDILSNFEFRFIKDSNINRHYKSLIRLKDFVSSGNTPHEFRIEKSCKYVNTAGEELPQPLTGMSDRVTWANMKIHHYMIKSKSEYVSKKMKKGRASSNASLDMSYFNAHDINHEYAPLKRHWIQSVQHIKNRLQEKYPCGSKDNGSQLYYKNNTSHIGAIDNLKEINNYQLEINGWALGYNGQKPESFRVIANQHLELPIKDIAFKNRPDVLRTIALCNDEQCGFTIACDVPQNEVINSISIYHGNNPIISTGLLNFQINELL
ncbi:glycosyltransferase family 2 protein [Silvania hatchlandensis]|uniref:Glycosyltransferase family 2 protein n=1 Tax=Silvania hatchlandensis TaxID=2926469 RepID=A0A9J6Q8I9_9ENTR|nr:glycosyltransferase family 2 protein [Silvania hatchlandensis]MCU6665594.1 glycosyltransferase family 2 protein [Silvania hatchlandensis]